MDAFARAWRVLEQHHQDTRHILLRDRFACEPDRFDRMHERLGGMLFDYSKNRLGEDTLQLLCNLAEAAGLGRKIYDLRTGAKVNGSENRAALHTALRLPDDVEMVCADGKNVLPEIRRELNRALDFARSLDDGSYQGITGKRITDFVHIGIGGSYLGPAMCVQALYPFRRHIGVHFAANADPACLDAVLCRLNPETAVFCVASKSFKTPETLLNAQAVKAWYGGAGFSEQEAAHHFCAVSADTAAAAAFGIAPERVFAMYDWVGGRYSVWSPVGLPVMVAVGGACFRELSAGAHVMDRHFFSTPPRHNIPVLMALIAVWYNNFQNADGQTAVPYSHNLRLLPAWLNQLDMESLGKSRTSDGSPAACKTGGIVFGGEGVDCQHAYFQLLHQGTRLIPCDFIVPMTAQGREDERGRFVVANAFAQAEALMKGKTSDEARAELAGLPETERERLAPHKEFPGNRPSNSILIDRLSPYNLGMLMAAYEHKTFVQGVIWNINPFDQWGVEYGKQLAKTIGGELQHGASAHDSSTEGLMAFYRECRLKGGGAA